MNRRTEEPGREESTSLIPPLVMIQMSVGDIYTVFNFTKETEKGFRPPVVAVLAEGTWTLRHVGIQSCNLTGT